MDGDCRVVVEGCEDGYGFEVGDFRGGMQGSGAGDDGGDVGVEIMFLL